MVNHHSRLIDLLQFVRHDKNDLTTYIFTYFLLQQMVHITFVYIYKEHNLLRSTFLHVNPSDKLLVLVLYQGKRKNDNGDYLRIISSNLDVYMFIDQRFV